MHIPSLLGAVHRFVPRDLSGLLIDLRAYVGATVSQWSDQSGNANHATQGTAAQQPAVSATAYGNFPGVTFDGSNDNMALPDSVTGAKTIAIAYKMASTPGSSTLRCLIRLKHSTTRSEILVINFTNYRELTFLFDFLTSGAAGRGIALPFDTNPHTVIVTYNGGTNTNSNSYTILVDGNPWVVVASATVNASASSVGSIGARATNTGFELYPVPGTYFRTLVYQGAKTAQECIKLHRCISRGFTSSPTATPQVVCDGNSLTFGFGATTPSGGVSVASYPQRMLVALGGAQAWGVWNLGVTGQTTGQMISDFATEVAPLRDPKRSKNILVCWEITNDIGLNVSNGVQAAANVATYCALGKAAGFTVIVCTCIARTWSGADATKEPYRLTANSTIVANYTTYAHALCDLAADSRLSDHTNLTYYNADGVHLTDAGYQVVADLIGAVVATL